MCLVYSMVTVLTMQHATQPRFGLLRNHQFCNTSSHEM
jgi:hypothetical protein